MNNQIIQWVLIGAIFFGLMAFLLVRTARRSGQRINEQFENDLRETIRQTLLNQGMERTQAETEAARQAQAVLLARERKINRNSLIFSGVYLLAALVVVLIDPLLGVIFTFFALLTVAIAVIRYWQLRR